MTEIMTLLGTLILPIKEAIQNGSIKVDDPIISEFKEKLIAILYDKFRESNRPINTTEIGAAVDKAFADILGFE